VLGPLAMQQGSLCILLPRVLCFSVNCVSRSSVLRRVLQLTDPAWSHCGAIFSCFLPDGLPQAIAGHVAHWVCCLFAPLSDICLFVCLQAYTRFLSLEMVSQTEQLGASDTASVSFWS